MNESTSQSPLARRGIAVTRPAQQARALSALIAAAGGTPIVFPVLEIADVTDARALTDTIDRLDQFDLAVFISPTAVEKALPLIRGRTTLPARIGIAAIGQGSTRALHGFGVGEVIAPRERFDSEALLDLPELQNVGGRRVIIFRGEGGRDLLGQTLTARGASVEYAECYRRCRPNVSAQALLGHWQRNELHAITVTSSEGLANLIEMVGGPGRRWLTQTPLFAPHPRIGAMARELGVQRVLVTPAGDEGLLQGLIDYFKGVNGEQ